MYTKRIRVLLLTFIVAVTMMAGSLSVFAAEGDEPEITKEVTMADGVTLADTTVTFEVKQVDNPDGLTAPATVAKYTVNTTVSSSKKTNTVAVGLKNKIDKTKPGEYTFEVAEIAPTAGTNWTEVDDTVYLVQVLVDNQRNVSYYVTKKGVTPAEGESAKTELNFKNKYEATTNLTVSKAVSGDTYVDTNTEYEFTVTFTANGVATVPETVSGKIGTGAATNYTVTDNKVTFKLKKDESIVFENLPAGIKYTVAETKPAPTTVTYKETTITQKADGETVMDGTTAVVTELQTLGNKGENSAAFTNIYEEITVTGVIMNVLPYFMMIAVAGAATAMYIASRRRRAAR